MTQFSTITKTKNCIVCNSQYSKRVVVNNIQFNKSRFCSKACKGKYWSINNVGNSNSNYKGGVSLCVDCNKKLNQRFSVDKRCRTCYTKFNIGENHPRWTGKLHKNEKGRAYPLCLKCKGITGDIYSSYCSKCFVRELRPSWKGGIAKLNSLIRMLPENRVWIKNCMKRDSYKCVECLSNTKIQVHHLKPFASILKENFIDSLDKARLCELLWDINNGKTLCLECHKLTDNYGNKKNI